MSKWLELKQISKIYRNGSKVEDISFSIGKGEIVALCGGNGAGKSTLIKIITGIIRQTGGEVLQDGKTADTISRRYRESFSYMPDDMLFPRQLTAKEVLSFFSALRGVPGERADEVLELVGLYGEKHRQISRFSKGMQQRLSFAQALLADTPLLIMDEPTNGLDPYWVWKFKEIIQEEKRKGKAILFTTHILPLVEEIADKAVFLEEGKLIHFDTVKEIMKTGDGAVSLESVFFSFKNDKRIQHN